MTKQEFDAIAARAKAVLAVERGDPNVVIICVDKRQQPIHPDALGEAGAARFKARCQATADAVKDRQTLLEFIAESFEIEWPEPTKPV